MAEKKETFLRSINNRQISFVRFINGTQNYVELYWINYEGCATYYGRLTPGSYSDIDTFVTHPWIFVHEETKERYLVNQKDVFYPEPWLKKCLNGKEVYSPHKINRVEALIMIPMYTLLELSARAIIRCLNSKEQIPKLNIPRCLQLKLASMLSDESDTNEDS